MRERILAMIWCAAMTTGFADCSSTETHQYFGILRESTNEHPWVFFYQRLWSSHPNLPFQKPNTGISELTYWSILGSSHLFMRIHKILVPQDMLAPHGSIHDCCRLPSMAGACLSGRLSRRPDVFAAWAELEVGYLHCRCSFFLGKKTWANDSKSLCDRPFWDFLQREVLVNLKYIMNHHHHHHHHHHPDPDFIFILFYAYLYGHYPGSLWMIVIIANPMGFPGTHTLQRN